MLLRVLYDPRLRRGMSEREGMPIVGRIVEEIGPGRRGPPPGRRPAVLSMGATRN